MLIPRTYIAVLQLFKKVIMDVILRIREFIKNTVPQKMLKNPYLYGLLIFVGFYIKKSVDKI